MPDISFIETAATLSTTTSGFETGSTGSPRIPFAFTSRARIEFAANAATIEAASIEPPDASDQRVRLGPSVVKMAVNPNSIKWSQGKRIVRKDTMEGSVYFHFLNKYHEDNDLARVEFSGLTGNIDTKATRSFNDIDSYKFQLQNRDKLSQWYYLWNLTREPMLYKSPRTNELMENRFYINYRTKLFPDGIQLEGIFDSALTFEESADMTNMARYSMSFVVFATTPSIMEMVDALNIPTYNFPEDPAPVRSAYASVTEPTE